MMKSFSVLMSLVAAADFAWLTNGKFRDTDLGDRVGWQWLDQANWIVSIKFQRWRSGGQYGTWDCHLVANGGAMLPIFLLDGYMSSLLMEGVLSAVEKA